MQSEQSERAQAELTATLEQALVRELVAEWRRINAAYFKGALTLPSIELSTNVTLGRWIQRGRTLEVSRPMILEQPWGAVIEVLKGHPLFAHVTLTRSERSPIAALVTELLENVTL